MCFMPPPDDRGDFFEPVEVDHPMSAILSRQVSPDAPDSTADAPVTGAVEFESSSDGSGKDD